ncbi:MAG: Ribosomal RNA small subunit methyltransferase I [Chlamydiae bacterium]|nr:Ribosomal RNA small subunit methyltransferase I [Chlamydiota bacterium]
MLYLVTTPIGNLKDITQRALEVLGDSDVILCEDTRHSSILLKHHGIQKPLKSYHKFSESKRENEVISLLREGKTISLISDAGTPCICDPGERLVQKCIEEGISVTPIPGPCALIHALVGSGLRTTPFQFVGFLPKKRGQLQETLLDILTYEGTTICYESPHRIKKVLELMAQLDPEREVVIARELTKKFEEFIRGPAQDIVEQSNFKGEIVLLIDQCRHDMWESLSLEQHLKMLQDTFQVSQKEAIKILAKIRPIPKKEIYNKFMKSNQKYS